MDHTLDSATVMTPKAASRSSRHTWTSTNEWPHLCLFAKTRSGLPLHTNYVLLNCLRMCSLTFERVCLRLFASAYLSSFSRYGAALTFIVKQEGSLYLRNMYLAWIASLLLNSETVISFWFCLDHLSLWDISIVIKYIEINFKHIYYLGKNISENVFKVIEIGFAVGRDPQAWQVGLWSRGR